MGIDDKSDLLHSIEILIKELHTNFSDSIDRMTEWLRNNEKKNEILFKETAEMISTTNKVVQELTSDVKILKSNNEHNYELLKVRVEAIEASLLFLKQKREESITELKSFSFNMKLLLMSAVVSFVFGILAMYFSMKG